MCLVILVFIPYLFNQKCTIMLRSITTKSIYVGPTDVMFIKGDQEKDMCRLSFAVPAANIPIYTWHCTPQTFKINTF